MKNKIKKCASILLFCLCLISCEDFVEVDAPNHKIIGTQVFSSDQMAISAMTGIYNQLMKASFSSGSSSSVSFLSGLSADNLQNIRETNLVGMQFERHEILPTNPNNLYLWSSAYNMIYLTNAFLEGLESSDDVSPELKSRLEGQAKFIRAFTYFYLVNLYGDVPLILTTDYRQNELAERDSEQEVYQQIIDDLNASIGLLGEEYPLGERTRVNKYAAMALLARVYLYREDWQLAEDLSSRVIAQSSMYKILEDLDEVFLANSQEAIWQISPIGRGNSSTHTNEGSLFIIHPTFYFFASVKLEEDLIETFQPQDKRLVNWTGFNETMEAFFLHKYKIWNSTEVPIAEYSMVLRLAEQYLIRAEARAAQGKIAEAIEDIDFIRTRAGLAPIAEVEAGLGQEDLLSIILQERRLELFGEWGHRWLDLKRTGRAGEILGDVESLWQPTDVYYPIPAQEIMKNPNLSQNNGY